MPCFPSASMDEPRVPTPVLQTGELVWNTRFSPDARCWILFSVLAVSRDGSRFYYPQAPDQPDSDVIHVRTGWFISR